MEHHHPLDRPLHKPETVGALGEEVAVSRLIALIPPRPEVIAGPGDDCAVIDPGSETWQLLKTDSVIEGVHFLPGTDPILVGRKAMNRVLSDIAAMGGRPRHALVTFAVDSNREFAEIEGWYRGLLSAAATFDCGIVGGETSRLPQAGAILTIAMTGTVRPALCVFRKGASPGDLIAVSGRLGGSFESGRHLTFTPRLKEAAWLVEHAKPTAMMDLSDGLGSDLPRLAAASGVGYRVESSSLPCHVGVTPDQAVADGEDYELLMTFSPETYREGIAGWREHFPDTPLTVIGGITEVNSDPLPRGWEHFRE